MPLRKPQRRPKMHDCTSCGMPRRINHLIRLGKTLAYCHDSAWCARQAEEDHDRAVPRDVPLGSDAVPAMPYTRPGSWRGRV